MSEKKAKYNVVFKGELVEGRDLETVKKNFEQLLKISPKTVETLFSSKALIIRKEVDIKTAAQFRNIFRKAGAVCKIRALPPEGK